MSPARFGPAGNAGDYPYPLTHNAPEWLRGLGLSAYEYQCGRGVHIGEASARKLGEAALSHDIRLSLHAPYYLSLSSEDPERVEKNIDYIRQSVQAAHWMGATRVVVHPGSGGTDRAQALRTCSDTLKKALDLCETWGFSEVSLCPETMGKIGQLGTFDEVMTLCGWDARLIPCLDFGHLYARSHGEINSHEAFKHILDALEDRLGMDRARVLHIHFSKIQFSKGGEVRHLVLEQEEYGPDFEPLARLMAERDYTPTVICESAGTQARDALSLMRVFERLRETYESGKS